MAFDESEQIKRLGADKKQTEESSLNRCQPPTDSYTLANYYPAIVRKETAPAWVLGPLAAYCAERNTHNGATIALVCSPWARPSSEVTRSDLVLACFNP
jgi:hypothetical protein